MSYKCEVCEQAVSPKVPLKKHVVKKPDGQIAREVRVCAECHAGFKSGYSLQQMLRICGRRIKSLPEPLAVAPRTVPASVAESAPRPKPLFARK